MTLLLLTVPIDQVLVAPQARTHFEPGAIAGLATSIQESGLQQPLLCSKNDDGYALIDGERRLRACRQLGWRDVPILVAGDRMSLLEGLTRQLASNLQREELSVLERATAIRELMVKGNLTADQVARRLGQSPATVSRTLSVLKLPDPIRARVGTREISPDAAYLLARVEDPTEQAKLATQVGEGHLSRDGLARKLKATRRSSERRSAGFGKATAILGNGRSVAVAGPGLTLESMMECLESLLARARKAKSQGITLETFVRALRDQAKGGKGAPS